MAKTISTKQTSFDAQPAADALPLPKAGLKEMADWVAFLNDEKNREIVSKWGKYSRQLKSTIKEHTSLEDVGSGMRIVFDGVGEVVIAPQKYAARNVQTEEKQIMRFTVVG